MEDRASNFFSYICQYLMKQFRFFREKDGIRPISCLFIYLFVKLLFIHLHHNDTSKRKRRYIKFYFSRIKILFSLTTNSVFPVISSISTTLEKSSYRFIFPVNVTSFLGGILPKYIHIIPTGNYIHNLFQSLFFKCKNTIFPSRVQISIHLFDYHSS